MIVKCKTCEKTFDFHKHYFVEFFYLKNKLVSARIVTECPHCFVKYEKELKDEPDKIREKLKQLNIL